MRPFLVYLLKISVITLFGFALGKFWQDRVCEAKLLEMRMVVNGWESTAGECMRVVDRQERYIMYFLTSFTAPKKSEGVKLAKGGVGGK